MFRADQMTELEWQVETEAIRDDVASLKGRPHEPQTMRQASRRLTDLLAAWRDAHPEQRARLAASIVSEIQVTDGRITAIRPRSAWVAFRGAIARWSGRRVLGSRKTTNGLAFDLF